MRTMRVESGTWGGRPPFVAMFHAAGGETPSDSHVTTQGWFRVRDQEMMLR